MHTFHGQPVRRLSSPFLTLEYLEHAGPRIVHLSFPGSPNLLAEVPEFTIPTPFGDYRIWGGHRLWHSPEAMPRTYIPDDDGLTIEQLPDGVALQGKIEPAASISKRIEIRLADNAPALTLVHSLINHGYWPVELAPWAITQLNLGGIVIAPLPLGNQDPHGLLPNRQFSLWPYARIHDARLHLEDDFILFEANALLPPFKIGYFNPHGWLAYWNDGVLFRKSFSVHPGVQHPDNNSNAEIYCKDQFVELESLAPLAWLAPGEKVQAVETWELFDRLDQPFVQAVVERVLKLSAAR